MKTFDEINEILSTVSEAEIMTLHSAIAEYYDFGESTRLELFATKTGLTIKEIFYWYNY